MGSRRPSLHVVRCALASGVMYYVVDLSRGDRGAVDWIVIALVAGAISWNVLQLGLRLHDHGGTRELGHLLRTLLLWTLVLLNAVLWRSEDIGTLRHRLAWVVILVAAFDTIALLRREMRCRGELASRA